jgi:hypothetical protein
LAKVTRIDDEIMLRRLVLPTSVSCLIRAILVDLRDRPEPMPVSFARGARPDLDHALRDEIGLESGGNAAPRHMKIGTSAGAWRVLHDQLYDWSEQCFFLILFFGVFAEPTIKVAWVAALTCV